MNHSQAGWRFRAGDHPQVEPLPAFADNYIWLLSDPVKRCAAVVDPGDAEPVLAALHQRSWSLSSILLTHHHRDHAGGVAHLVAETGARVFGPAAETIAGVDQALEDGNKISPWDGGPSAHVLDIPGHTRGHIAYLFAQIGEDQRPVLFCGDTLFAAGCGRIFEGTPAQMLSSLDRLAALPGPTLVFCAHEYTVSNLRFARAAEPDSAPVAERLAEALAIREAGLPTLPSSIAIELASNPFLRAAEPGVWASVTAETGHPPADRLQSFSALREWKNRFR
jgi:hydroxyacylglutathione hydrolase